MKCPINLQNSNLFKTQNYINGQWLGEPSTDVINPFDQSVICQIPNHGETETKQAIEAASHAFESWSQQTAAERATYIQRWAALITANIDDLANLMTLEQGKPVTESHGEIEYGNQFNYWFAEEAKRLYGDIIPTTEKNRRLFVLKQPVGVCAAITPWNFPSAMILRKAAPALAAGCTIVIKPSGQTPLSALALAVLAEEAGIPAGVFNIITGDSSKIGNVLATHPDVKKLSFTGSTRVGKLLMEQCSSTVKKLSLELGGNAPFIVFDDANIDEAVNGLMVAKFRNTGQACVSANRIYLHESIYDTFLEKLKTKIKTLIVGNGFDKNTTIGPLINQMAIEKIQTLITDATQRGAHIVAGGQVSRIASTLFEPTIITDIPHDAKMSCEEIFGPVIAVYRFKDTQDVIHQANDTNYGLAAYFFSNENKRIWETAEALQFGMVGINAGVISTAVAPFGGVKESGFGREGSKYGIDDYLNIKYCCLSLN